MALAGSTASGQNLYRCIEQDGSLSFQDLPCSGSTEQQAVTNREEAPEKTAGDEGDVETVEGFLALTRDELAANISAGAQGERIRQGFLEVGLADVDAEKIANAWGRDAAECVVARMRKQLVGVDSGDEAKRVRFLRGLLENKQALHRETTRCMYKSPVRADQSVIGTGWFARAMLKKEEEEKAQ